MVVQMAYQIPEEMIEEVRKSNDIVDVIGEYVQLKKQGKNFVGLCPFHGEKTPSFSVTQDKQIFHCFGCGKGGNVVTFMMEMEKFSFIEAITHLAERCGINLPITSSQNEFTISQESQNILTAYDWLTKLYHHLLRYTRDGKEGYQYLIERGINDHAIDEFQLGFATTAKSFTAEFLKKKGFNQALLVKEGLLSLQNDNSVTDRFRGRIIFPIRNHLGKTVAFGGRLLADGGPKYLNSPESELFQKGKILYNFDLAKKHIRKENEVILFEGYMDVIAAYQAGIKNVVATLGTALTETQAKLLKRYVDTVVVCYDGDKAGLEATYKAVRLLQSVGCQVKIANLKEGLDPDSYIKLNGGEAFQNKVLDTSETYLSFYMRYLKKDYNLHVEGDRIDYIEKVIREISTVNSLVEREYYLRDLHNEFNISMESLTEEVEIQRRRYKDQSRNKDNSSGYSHNNRANIQHNNKKLLPAYQNAERKLLAYMLQDELIAEKVQEDLGARFNLDMHKIIATHLYAFYEEGHKADVSLFIERLKEPELQKLASEIAMYPTLENISDQEISDYIRIIKVQNDDYVHIQTLKEEQRLAEQQSDPLKAAQIAMQIIEIKKQSKRTN